MQTIEQDHFDILKIIYSIVKDDPYPLKCNVHPRELILRSMQQWNSIHSSLTFLEKEGLIATRQLDTLQIALTGEGLALCRASGPM